MTLRIMVVVRIMEAVVDSQVHSNSGHVEFDYLTVSFITMRYILVYFDIL
jgi:hypothetical protein